MSKGDSASNSNLSLFPVVCREVDSNQSSQQLESDSRSGKSPPRVCREGGGADGKRAVAKLPKYSPKEDAAMSLPMLLAGFCSKAILQ